MNRRIRDPYVRWSCLHFITADKCEGRTPLSKGGGVVHSIRASALSIIIAVSVLNVHQVLVE